MAEEVDAQRELPAELANMYADGAQRMFCETLSGEAEAVWQETLARLQDEVHEDDLVRYDAEFYWRFVKGSMFEPTREKRVASAVDRLRKTFAWRRANDVDEVLGASFPNLGLFRESLWPLKLLGTDSDGHAVVLIRLRDCDWRKAAKLFPTKAEILRYMTFMQEFHMARLRAMRVSSNQVWIYDVGGLGMADYGLAYSNGLSALFNLWGAHYPESIKALYLLNMPFIFQTIYGFVKGFIEPDTLDKIHMVKSSKAILGTLENAGVALPMLPESMGGQGFGSYLLPDAVVALKAEDDEASASLTAADVVGYHFDDIQALGFKTPAETKLRATSSVFDIEVDSMGGLDPDLASFNEAPQAAGHRTDVAIFAGLAGRIFAVRDFFVTSAQLFTAAFREHHDEDEDAEVDAADIGGPGVPNNENNENDSEAEPERDQQQAAEAAKRRSSSCLSLPKRLSSRLSRRRASERPQPDEVVASETTT